MEPVDPARRRTDGPASDTRGDRAAEGAASESGAPGGMPDDADRTEAARGGAPGEASGEDTLDGSAPDDAARADAALGGRSDGGTSDGGVAGKNASPVEHPSLGEVLLAAEELWPESLAEPWDAVGLVLGRAKAPVGKILFAVDPVCEVVDEALEWGADLLITHHPLLLKPVSSVAGSDFKGDIVHRLIEGGCGLLTIHTNGDSAVGGVSDVLADALGLRNVQPLTHAAAGLDEEGIGRVGELDEVTSLADFAANVFSILPAVAGGVKVAGDPDGLVRRVAVCGGAGDALFDEVRESEADVYVTADLRHHPASEAREGAVSGRPYLIDVSHFGSEWLWLTPAAEALDNVLADQDYEVDVRVSSVNTDPWDFILTPGRG